MELHVRRTSPDALVETVVKLADQVVVCQFESPLSDKDLQALAATLSVGNARPETIAIRAIRYEPTVTDSTALSLDSLSMHTDGAFLPEPPRRFILSCRRADEGGGGVSWLLPVSRIVDSAPLWVLRALRTAAYRFLMTYDGDLATSFTGPVLYDGQDGAERIRWRGDHIYRPVPTANSDAKAAPAAEWLYSFLGSAESATYTLRQGELMVVPNEFFVHGRSQLSRDSSREIMRAWAF
jgi:hypothetical protein